MGHVKQRDNTGLEEGQGGSPGSSGQWGNRLGGKRNRARKHQDKQGASVKALATSVPHCRKAPEEQP